MSHFVCALATPMNANAESAAAARAAKCKRFWIMARLLETKGGRLRDRRCWRFDTANAGERSARSVQHCAPGILALQMLQAINNMSRNCQYFVVDAQVGERRRTTDEARIR